VTPREASFGTQLRLLARRSIARTLKDPGTVLSALVFPLILFAIVSAGLNAATEIPGFPTTNFTSFALAIAFANGAMVMVAGAGQGIASDVESGFINRMALTPMRGEALLAAQLAGAVVLALIQAGLYIAVGYAAGARIEAGFAGGLVLVALFLASATGFGALGMFVGIRTGSTQAVQALAPMTLVLLFLSSVNLPRDLIETDWFYWIATVNPVSYLVEGMRSLLISGWDAEALALGFAVAGALIVLALAASTRALRLRLVRT
jgi:ABC-2 type transport system permease protein